MAASVSLGQAVFVLLVAAGSQSALAGLVTFDEVDTSVTDEVVCVPESGGLRFEHLSPVKCVDSIGVFNATSIYGRYNFTVSSPNGAYIQAYPYFVAATAGGRFDLDSLYLAATAAAFHLEGLREGVTVYDLAIGTSSHYDPYFSSLTPVLFPLGWSGIDTFKLTTLWIDGYLVMDNVAYTPAVPEPASYLLVLAGLALVRRQAQS